MIHILSTTSSSSCVRISECITNRTHIRCVCKEKKKNQSCLRLNKKKKFTNSKQEEAKIYKNNNDLHNLGY